MTAAEIHKVCKMYNIKNYTINSDGSIDVVGDVDLCNMELTRLPLRFGKVSGDFDCAFNFNLASLEGAPVTVGGDFNCAHSHLSSLVGCTTSVSGDFDCAVNFMTSLVGAPVTVGGDFYCDKNKLTSLEGAPVTVGGDFYCNYNMLTSLNGIGEVSGEIHLDGDLLRIYQRTQTINAILES